MHQPSFSVIRAMYLGMERADNPSASAKRDGKATGISAAEQKPIQAQVKTFEKYIDSGGFLDANNP